MHKRAKWTLWVGAAVGIVLALVVLAGVFLPKPEAEAQRLPKFVQRGLASWYGPSFHGEKTASGEIYDQNDLTAAHRKLPLGTKATVTNLENNKQVEVEINDRGPYVGEASDRSVEGRGGAARDEERRNHPGAHRGGRRIGDR